MCTSKVQYVMRRKTGCNRSNPVFFGFYIFTKTWQLATGLITNVGNWQLEKTGLWFSPVQSYVYFQSCRLDLRTLKMDDAENQVHNTGHGVSVTQDMEEGNVDSEVPHASNEVLGEGDADAVGAPATLPPTTNLNDTIIHSETKGHLFSNIGKKISKIKSKVLYGIHKKRGNAVPCHTGKTFPASVMEYLGS
ncbi:uncharacterized protein LACBIDRAFT_334519 [Laccaria bicolor S238N-H82]|uniref:Predicted protein n=1 Tax=Laccaria bicolor (strain S238N-H82 / ATCC MYA-4686) TaxID=486041 RepID=B0DZE8_LACBS|nr:uncharacterized protein LACBIDRAFT_334519 [Laccaria bicolor S238N-H82]EDR00003.1 predicted protein [Laccaria bicolor S238N-H82]|eukprot:XP_001889312.1 predicted protein [Laccaria bicolor S238N-H82]